VRITVRAATNSWPQVVIGNIWCSRWSQNDTAAGTKAQSLPPQTAIFLSDSMYEPDRSPIDSSWITSACWIRNVSVVPAGIAGTDVPAVTAAEGVTWTVVSSSVPAMMIMPSETLGG